MAPDTTVKETKATDAGALLDAGDGAVVTLVAGDTQLAAHRAVLTTRSPVFDAMFRHDTLEASSGRVTITDVEGPVLRQLLAYCYTLKDLQPPSMALQLVVAADKYGLVGLKTRCEQQAAANLAVENAEEAAVLAVRHSCQDLTASAVPYLKDHLVDVVGTEGWANMMRNHTEDLIRVSKLVAKPPTRTRSLSGEEKGKRLMQAAKDGSWEQLQTLMMAGADVGVRDGSKLTWTPLHWAAHNGHMEAVRCLLESGAEVDSTGKSQHTPLHTSAFKGHTAVVQLLVAFSADPNFKDDTGRTALHWAALSGHAEVVAVLLGIGADRGIRDNGKKSPLDLATEKKHQKVIELLK